MSFPTFFSRGVNNTLLFKNGGQFLYKGPWTSIFTNTEIDRWYVGDFASAVYNITVELDSNKKETLQVMVVARPDEANFAIFGRASIDDELVDVSAVVNDSYVSVRLSAKISSFEGAKAIYNVSYSGSINTPIPPVPKTYLVPDTQPDPTPGGSSGGVSGGASVVLTSLNSHLVPSQDATYNVGSVTNTWDNVYVKDTVYFNNAPISATGSTINLPEGTKIDGDIVNYFNRIIVPGQNDIVSSDTNDSLTIRAGSNIDIQTDPITKEITINSTGGGGAAVVSSVSNSGPSFGVVAVAGQSSLIADRDQDQLTLTAGANITLTTDPITDTITISALGGGGGGGTSSTVIVNPVTSGTYPLTMASGTSSISGNILYGNSGITVDVDTSTLNATAQTARWADLAEKYIADKNYESGTVLIFGGPKEVTEASGIGNKKVAGVVSTNPAFIMNNDLKVENTVIVALQGRVPCKVVGNIKKGDMLIVSDVEGVATASDDPKLGSVIGKALEDYSDTQTVGTIEIVVGRM